MRLLVYIAAVMFQLIVYGVLGMSAGPAFALALALPIIVFAAVAAISFVAGCLSPPVRSRR